MLSTVVFFTYGVQAQLPQPLTLEAALQFVDKNDHFEVHATDQLIAESKARAESSDATNDLSIKLSGQLRKVGIPDTSDATDDNDSAIHLFVKKPLYDFGQSNRREQLAQLNIELSQLQKQYLLQQRELDITQRYFDVLNADNEFLRHNEDLAIGFIAWDRLREKMELELVSLIEVKKAEVAYEKIRQARYQAENKQRFTRTLLAELLGFPSNPPSNVSPPSLPERQPIIDNVEAMIQQAYKHSLRLAIEQKKVDISRLEIELAEDTVGPRIDAELQLSDYARPGSLRDDWRASIYFDVPLYSGRSESSAVKVAQSRHRQALASYQSVRSEIRMSILEIWQQIQQFALEQRGDEINLEYRELYLDRSRAEYELEFKTDLGDSMVQFSESRMNLMRSRYALELAWRKLEKLVGDSFAKTLEKTTEQNG